MLEKLRVHGVDLRQPLRREAELQPHALGDELGDVLVDDVADMLEVDREGLHLAEPARFRFAQALARDRGDVALQRLVQAVDDVVQAARLGDPVAVVAVEVRPACRRASAR